MRFRERTDLLSLPLQEIADRLGIPYRTLTSYRYGHRAVPEEVLKKLATIMREHCARLAEAADELESEE